MLRLDTRRRTRPQGADSSRLLERPRGGMTIAFTFPGQGSQAVGMGQGARRGLSGGARRLRRGRRRARRKAVDDHLRRPDRDPDPDRERPAGADGGEPRGDARARGEGRRHRTASPMSPAIRSANIRRSPLPAASASPTRRGFSASAAGPCRRRCRSGVGAMAALLGLDLDAATAIAADAAEGEVCAAANDNGAGRSSSRATRRRSSGRSRSPRRGARSAPCSCR